MRVPNCSSTWLSHGHGEWLFSNELDYLSLYNICMGTHKKPSASLLKNVIWDKNCRWIPLTIASMLDLRMRIARRVYVTWKEKETLLVMVQCSNWSVLDSYMDSHSHFTGLVHPHSPHVTWASTMQSIRKHETCTSAYNATLLTSLPNSMQYVLS